MTLNPHPIFPAAGHYVLRLHQEANLKAGQLQGRIQHVSSGDCSDFATVNELIEWLVSHAASLQASTTEPPTGGTA